MRRDGNVTAYNWNETLKEKTVVAFGLGKFFREETPVAWSPYR